MGQFVVRFERPVIFLAIGQTIVWASLYYSFPALLLHWEQQTSFTKAELTGALALAVLVSAAASPVAGRFIDSGQGAALMAGSAFMGAMGLCGVALSETLFSFYLCWGIIGVTLAGCLYEPCFAIVTRARGAQARSAITLITLVAGFAGTISFPANHWLAEWFGWRAGLGIMAAGVMLGGVPLLWIGAQCIGAAEIHETDRHAPVDRSFLTRPAFFVLAMTFSIVALIHGALLHHFLPLLDSRGVRAEIAVIAAACIGPMQVAGRIAMMLSERFVSLNGVVRAAFVAIICAATLLRFGGASVAAIGAFVLLFGSAYGTISILRPLVARDVLGPGSFGAKSGALALPYLAGSATAPYLGSLIWAFGGYDLMLSCTLGLGALALVAHSLLARLP